MPLKLYRLGARPILVSGALLAALLGAYALFGHPASVLVLFVGPIWFATRLNGRQAGAWFVLAAAWLTALVERHPANIAVWQGVLRTGCFGAIMLLIAETERRVVRGEREAQLDSLTGLLNRRGLLQMHADRLETSRSSPPSLSVVMVDCNEFKALNDEHGHLVGDEVLQLLARALQRHTRRSDLVARYGGDEFVVVLQGAPDGFAKAVMRRIDGAFEASVAGLGYRASIAYGCASGVLGVDALEELIEAADREMYDQKSRRRPVYLQ